MAVMELTSGKISEALEIPSNVGQLLAREVMSFVRLQSETWRTSDDIIDHLRSRSGYYDPEIQLSTAAELPNGGVDQTFLVISDYSGVNRSGVEGAMKRSPMKISLARGVRVGIEGGVEGLFVKSLEVGELEHGGTEIKFTQTTGMVSDKHLSNRFSGILFPQV